MSAKVLAFVEDPGAANGVLGLDAELTARGARLVVVAIDRAAASLADRVTFEGATPGEGAEALLARHAPDALLVGTSENPETLGLALVDAARARGVPSAGFVDAFPNAAYRFRGATDDPLAHCPDVVLVPDAWTRDAFVALGLAAERAIVTGHPMYDAVLAKKAALDALGVACIRTRLFPDAPPGARVVTFCAEISTGFDAAQFRRSDAYTLHGRGGRDGRTEIVLEELLDAAAAAQAGGAPLYLVLRMHPKNTREELGALLDEVDLVSAGGDPHEVVYASDLACGMTTTLLVEASLLGKPTLAIVPRALEAEWLPTIRAGVTPCVSTRDALARELSRLVAGEVAAAAPFAEPGAAGRLADALVSLTRRKR